jgi:hypothetical protein
MTDHAKKLADTARANVEACYKLTEANFRVEWCEDPVWSERFLRLKTEQLAAATMANATHLDMIDALKAYDEEMKINALTKAVTSLEEKLRRAAETKSGDIPLPQEIETEQEDDGRWLANVVGSRGVMAYGATKEQAIENVRALWIKLGSP